MRMPDGLECWTADEAAECLNLPDSIYSKLWGFLAKAKNPTPSGGDGSPDSDGRRTVETPDGRLDPANDDKASSWWGKLSEDEQRLVADAFKEGYGESDEGEAPSGSQP